MKKLAIAAGALALAGCQSLPVGSNAPTAENVRAAVLIACSYVAPVAEIAALLKANAGTLSTAAAIAKVICDTAAGVVASTPAPQGLIALPQRPVTVVLDGVPIHLTPAPQ